MTAGRSYADVQPATPVAAPQVLALLLGIVYTAVGLLGFFVRGAPLAGPEGANLLGFEVNHLHNVVHLVTGLAALASWSRLHRARLLGWTLAVTYAAVTLYGLAADGRSWDLLAVNAADHVLHAVTALAGALVGAGSTNALREPRYVP